MSTLQTHGHTHTHAYRHAHREQTRESCWYPETSVSILFAEGFGSKSASTFLLRFKLSRVKEPDYCSGSKDTTVYSLCGLRAQHKPLQWNGGIEFGTLNVFTL